MEDINYKYAVVIYIKGLLQSGRIKENASRLEIVNNFLKDFDEMTTLPTLPIVTGKHMFPSHDRGSDCCWVIMAMGCGLGYAWVGFIRFAI